MSSVYLPNAASIACISSGLPDPGSPSALIRSMYSMLPPWIDYTTTTNGGTRNRQAPSMRLAPHLEALGPDGLGDGAALLPSGGLEHQLDGGLPHVQVEPLAQGLHGQDVAA